MRVTCHEHTRARSTALMILSCRDAKHACMCELGNGWLRTFVSSEGILGVDGDGREGGVESSAGRCRQLFGLHGRLEYSRLGSPSSTSIRTKMPLGPPSSAVFIQNAGPGFISAPG